MRILRSSLCLLALTVAAGAAVAARAPVADRCNWDRPGHDPYTGDVPSALDRYPDLQPAVRQRLRDRMARRDYDDVVTIRRDGIVGKDERMRYDGDIHDMHFGAGRVCRDVSRAKWSDAMEERGLVYCDSGECILVPTVCRNVSRIARAEVGDERADAPPPGAPPASPDDGIASASAGPIGDAAGPSFASVVGPLAAPPGAAGEGSGYPAPPWFGGGGAGSGGSGPFAQAPIGPGGGGGVPVGGGTGPGGGTGGPGGGTGGPVGGPGVPGGGTDIPGGSETPIGPVPAVPEPDTWALLGCGLAALAALPRRRRSPSVR